MFLPPFPPLTPFFGLLSLPLLSFPPFTTPPPTNSLHSLTPSLQKHSWESYFSGSAWTYHPPSDEYYLHLFAPEQPDLNWEHPPVCAAVHRILRFWLARGVDGFRMDVINFISKEPGLPDGPVVAGKEGDGSLQSGIRWHSCGPRLHEWLKGLGGILAEFDAFSVGEMPGVTDAREIVKGVGQERGELGMAFQFEM